LPIIKSSDSTQYLFTINIKGVHTIEFNGCSQQLPAYNDFLKIFSSKFDWVAFLDVDEFFVLKKHSTIKSFLRDYRDVWSGLPINWVMFGSNGHSDVEGENYNVLERFTRSARSPNCHIKSILRIKRSNWLQQLFRIGKTKVQMINPHHPNIALLDTRREKVEGPFNPGGPVNLIQINHYWTKSPAEFRVKVGRGRADQPRLRDISEFDYEDNVSKDAEDLTVLNFYTKNDSFTRCHWICRQRIRKNSLQEGHEL